MTTDTPTPRTKGMTGTFYLRCDDCPQPHKCESHKCVHPDDCADIERDLSECRAALAERQADAERRLAVIAELVARRDEWKATALHSNDLLERADRAWINARGVIADALMQARALATKDKEPQPAAKEDGHAI